MLKSPALFRTQSSDWLLSRDCVFLFCDWGSRIYVIQFVAVIRTLRIDVMTITERGSIFLFSKHRLSSCIRGWFWLRCCRKSYTRWQLRLYEKRDLRRYIKIHFSLFLFLFSSRSSEQFYGAIEKNVHISRWKNHISGNTKKSEST